MSRWARVLGAPRAAVNIISEDFVENLPNVFIALGLGLAGIVVAWIFIKISECCTGTRISKRWKRDREDTLRWKSTTNRSKNSRIRFILLCFAIISAISGFWVAAHTAGFNFWTVVLGYGILTLVANSAFGGMLRDGGAFFLIALTDKIQEDWWIEVVGMGVAGRITAIHILWVEIEYLDTQGNMEEAHIPTAYIMANVIKRKFAMEKDTSPVVRLDPATNKNVVKKGLRNNNKLSIV